MSRKPFCRTKEAGILGTVLVVVLEEERSIEGKSSLWRKRDRKKDLV
jgi:hypothetical protein